MKLSVLKKEIERQTEDLPEEILREILDFIQFLRIKKQTDNIDLSAELSQLNLSEQSHLEEEFKDYKTVYPKK